MAELLQLRDQPAGCVLPRWSLCVPREWEIAVPGLGAELMDHVQADDVAHAFHLAIEHREAAAGESFNVVAPSALTARDFLAIAASWFGQPARTRSVSWTEFRSGTTADFADSSWEHFSRSQYASIDKARTLLGYPPPSNRRPLSWKASAG